jgi:uncharacterized protein YodC (DUF2158 family)
LSQFRERPDGISIARLPTKEYPGRMTIGDIVKLLGGDRSMVVVAIQGENVECEWYEGEDRVAAEFHIESLEAVTSVNLGAFAGPFSH